MLFVVIYYFHVGQMAQWKNEASKELISSFHDFEQWLMYMSHIQWVLAWQKSEISCSSISARTWASNKLEKIPKFQKSSWKFQFFINLSSTSCAITYSYLIYISVLTYSSDIYFKNEPNGCHFDDIFIVLWRFIFYVKVSILDISYII